MSKTLNITFLLLSFLFTACTSSHVENGSNIPTISSGNRGERNNLQHFNTTFTKYALLIGVSNYPLFPATKQLPGTQNDIQLMYNLLQEKGFDKVNIQRLADGVVGAPPPTRAAILHALEILANKVTTGDFVYLHFSGHGTQQPNQPQDKAEQEPDGLDELFLPKDASHWEAEKYTVTNAIVDDEMHTHLMAIRQRGAFVWAVFDSCHSGSMTREAVTLDYKPRRLDAKELGIPELKLVSPVTLEEPLSVTQETQPVEKRGIMGGYVAFFAAQTTEIAPEMRLPVAAETQKVYGLLTYMLSQALALDKMMSYRQLGQQILQYYAVDGFEKPTPLFVGDNLDALVFAQTTPNIVRQWIFEVSWGEMTLKAGQLHQLSKGDVLTVLPKPTAKLNETLGYIAIAHSDLLTSQVKTITYNEKPSSDVFELSEYPQPLYARLVHSEPDFSLRVALPSEQNLPSDLRQKVTTLFTKLKNTKAVLIKPVTAKEDATVRLAIKDTKLEFLSPLGEPLASNQLALNLKNPLDQLYTALSNILIRIAKVKNLQRIANLIAEQSSVLEKQLQITTKIKKVNSNQIEEIQPGYIPELQIGDVITYSIKNTGNTPIDITVLFVDSHYNITLVFPFKQKMITNRIEKGGWHLPITINADVPGGIEQLILIAVPAEKTQLINDFSFLAQSQLPVLSSEERKQLRNSQISLLNLFEKAGFGKTNLPAANNNRTAIAHAQVFMEILSWRNDFHI